MFGGLFGGTADTKKKRKQKARGRVSHGTSENQRAMSMMDTLNDCVDSIDSDLCCAMKESVDCSIDLLSFDLSPVQQQQQQQQQRKRDMPINSEDKLRQLIQIQEFTGDFDPQKISQLTNTTTSAMQQAAVKLNGCSEQIALRIIATAIAIVFMDQHLSNLRDKWHLIEAKAMRWLGKNVPSSQVSSDTFISTTLIPIAKEILL